MFASSTQSSSTWAGVFRRDTVTVHVHGANGIEGEKTEKKQREYRHPKRWHKRGNRSIKQPNRIDRLGDSIHSQYPTSTALPMPLKHMSYRCSLRARPSPKNHTSTIYTSIRVQFYCFISARISSPVRCFFVFCVVFPLFFWFFCCGGVLLTSE